MANFLNFQTLTVVGSTREEALASAPFTAAYDATQAYHNWEKKQTGAVTDAMVKEFMVEYLEKKTKNVPGAGCFITVQSAVKDTRERPYTYENVKREGSTHPRTTYVWLDDNDGHEVCKVVSTADKRATKAAAAEAIKKVMASGEYKGKASLFVRKEEEKPVAVAHCAYTPSKSCKSGKYLVFGIQA